MGKLLCEMPDKFWPSRRVQAGLEVGIFVCGFDISGMTSDEQDIDTVTLGPPEIVTLDVNVQGKRNSLQ